jgi:hypothetical protein
MSKMHRQIVKMEYESIKIKENINRHWIDGDNIASPSPSNGLKSKKKRKKGYTKRVSRSKTKICGINAKWKVSTPSAPDVS